MSKFFKTADDIKELAESVFKSTGLESYGIKLKVMSTVKGSTVVKVSRASAVTEYLTREEDIIQLIIYESAFDRLNDEEKKMILEGAFSNVMYDSEKDKLNVDSSQYGEVINMRKKYGEKYMDLIESSLILIEQIEEEKKEQKAAEKAAKKASKNK